MRNLCYHPSATLPPRLFFSQPFRSAAASADAKPGPGAMCGLGVGAGCRPVMRRTARSLLGDGEIADAAGSPGASSVPIDRCIEINDYKKKTIHNRSSSIESYASILQFRHNLLRVTRPVMHVGYRLTTRARSVSVVYTLSGLRHAVSFAPSGESVHRHVFLQLPIHGLDAHFIQAELVVGSKMDAMQGGLRLSGKSGMSDDEQRAPVTWEALVDDLSPTMTETSHVAEVLASWDTNWYSKASLGLRTHHPNREASKDTEEAATTKATHTADAKTAVAELMGTEVGPRGWGH
ncbi:uncharacterized protein LY79DRAFT_663169 [Colletotrichum navitas]|uniref:Uncharacterized protein n=1 Tax=Colletotrichum navitas TaxID=681940 RepID=A0AAD8PM73_9PEZI|nr:uncharacterized protein LY79DRAFT_663169 [Colletotrichum navitas]KAK1572657.1 hypothetical protein LY79DRAFT_663169 [Colletotrichum navitas]